ncbi:Mitochondrial carrier protein,Mitochondrial carrier domain,Mitochondrial substrate/solute carrier [Cinara cedri]|uniref:Mitochondrial carrier protein,Mitochondrial carrier domain,Mitochondrial substrate/solute carrier n=1 Tax=Cinara cedri TaxID=506608 RepID=A0A5E4MCW1_9HEMI|nr:Mitochondrial carrier protein,Mitochondrial carrier domain,Mitochondrial substrate/solute carrier [Cinara cedri]
MDHILNNSNDIATFIKEHLILKSIIAGSTSGLFSTVLFQPFDVVKTVLQDPLMKKDLGLINATKLVWKQEPFYGFWRGLAPSLARNIPGIAIHIPLTQIIYKHLKNNDGNSMMKSGIAGFSARCITVTILMPFTVLKTRIESGLYHYTNLANGLSNMYTFEGWKVMYRGWTPTILRDAPFSALYFMFFTQFKNTTLFEKLDKKETFYIFGSGLLAGVLASCITQPFDVIKTSQQLSKEKIIFFDAILLIKQKYGVAGYFRGLSLRILRRSIMVALTWTLFEQLS